MKAYKIHIKPFVVEAEDEVEAMDKLFKHTDKLEVSLFEEVNLDAI